MNLGDFTSDWTPETVIRNSGITAEERYLHRLCDRTFLSLWSYSSLFRDQRADSKGDGKELGDLLVVCGNDILIFSDKGCIFPNSGDIRLDWPRWFKRAIQKSAEQAWGAGRWIMTNRNRIFLDRPCTKKFPIDLPPQGRMRIHYIVVAHNVSDRCAAHFHGSSGTLMFDSFLTGPDPAQPFVVGWLHTARPFVHVLDDESLDVLLATCDTITDFVRYLQWKEAFLQSARDRKTRVLYCGEEDLLANYLLSTNDDRHGFALPDEPLDVFYIDEGDWKGFVESPQRSAQIEADRDSYFWDYLIEKFCKNILAGTSYDRATPFIADREKAVRMLALEPRIRRRILARGLIGLLRKTAPNVRAVRVVLPDRKADPYFCFLLVPRFGTMPIDTYRQIRGQQLEALIRVAKFVYPEALDIIGFATESGPDPIYRSEDLMYLDARRWTAEEQEHARQLQKDFNFLTDPKVHFSKDYDFPVDLPLTLSQSAYGFPLEKNPRNKPCPCGSGKKFKKCHGV